MTGRRQFGNVRKLPSGRWQARYRDHHDIQHVGPVTFATKAEANRFLATVETDLNRGDWTDHRLGRTKFSACADEWLATVVHLKAKTRVGYVSQLRSHVMPAFGNHSVGALTQADVRVFVSRMVADGAAPGTVRNAYRVVRLVLDTAVASGALKTNPAIGVKLPRSERSEMIFLTSEQVDALADEINQHYRVMILFAAYTGLRAAEIAGLRVGRVDLLRGVVDVVETIGDANGHLVSSDTKTHERRTVPLPRFLVDELIGHLGTRSAEPNALVFTSARGQPIRQNNFYRRHFTPAVARAGLPTGTRFHDLRHTCAALLIAQGAHPKAIAELLGHSTITVTLDRYGHLFPSLAEALAEGLDRTYRETPRSRKGTPPVIPIVRPRRGASDPPDSSSSKSTAEPSGPVKTPGTTQRGGVGGGQRRRTSG